MASTDGVKLVIDDKLVTAIVAAEVQGAVVKALGGDVYNDVLRGIIGQALNQKVDREGRPSNYGDLTFMQHSIDTAIRKMVQSIIKDALAEHADLLKEQMKAAIRRQGSAMANAFVASVIDSASSDWRINVETSFSLKNNER